MEKLNILNELDTIDYIIKNNCSISRYGDGEFNLIKGSGIHFQDFNVYLQNLLSNILKKGSNEKCLIAIPPVYNHNDKKTKRYWDKIKNKPLMKISYDIMNKKCLYGSSFISRVECLPYDKNEYLNKLKILVSNSKNIFIVNENVKQLIINKKISYHNFIIIKDRNAFDDYSKIIQKITMYGKEYKYFICAGPTATIISYNLSLFDYIIIDLGHFFNLLD